MLVIHPSTIILPMSSDTLKFEVSFKKVTGSLSVTQTLIAWNPAVAGTMDRQQQALNRVTNMLASKAGSARTSLKLVFQDDVPVGGLLFTFTGPTKDADRQAVQDRLIPFVSAHRTPAASTPVPNPALAAVASGSNPASTPGSPAPGTPGTPVSIARKRKAEDISPADAEARRRMNKVRERVLRSNPTLQALHRELVQARQITEEEFWDGKQRQALLKSEELAYAQRPGRPSRLLDDRFDLSGDKRNEKFRGGTGVGLKKVESGPIVLNITKELTREIFEEFPVVQDAYAKNVPRISESDFWTRYFTSTLWERHRASVRKTALDEGARRKDDIFDVYLEDPDWEIEPRKKMPDSVETYLDLAATEEDHGDVTTIRDVTMQAGKERSSLPLIRRFNQHSEKLLRAGRQEASVLTPSSELMEQIDMEDLHAPAAPAVIPLNVANEDSDGKSGPRGIFPGRSDADLLAMAEAEAVRVASWDADFASVCLPNPNPAEGGPGPGTKDYDAYAYQRDAQFVAQRVVRDMHNASNAEDAEYPHLPQKIVDDMRSCHNAACEFLRQYWAAVLPPAAGTLATNQSPAVRAARAAKMAEYLLGTEGKVEAIVMTAQMERADPVRVRAAMAPTLGAVAVALKREKARVGKA
ncbi:uncharacterized protein CcaverHIS019_0308190 [Cutaneotrichosporon cavernicola]|uniref:BSD domain-containing protein n=1 Tax=Cutaneotrichosporon cavernicola TaxID=279322 RepID=A0AA48I6R9_9TREE|nr:uncharacterized protein CcaverHIS019_0308190 [Cutaneotrichosporon cavernicola]BEI90749.1 hypothetical protein CcaverHIS019_0308190 [Cutaneotrichosporon cavernicola]BEI98529.1 hypothetical protein CcaverHIS631_0308280 [Cutaneotrichosporon cavernicola]